MTVFRAAGDFVTPLRRPLSDGCKLEVSVRVETVNPVVLHATPRILPGRDANLVHRARVLRNPVAFISFPETQLACSLMIWISSAKLLALTYTPLTVVLMYPPDYGS